MASNTFDLIYALSPDNLAEEIAMTYERWRSNMVTWTERTKAIRDEVYATDLGTTEGAHLPFKNSTVIPKLAQIQENLHSNYMMSMFPNDEWISWEAANNDAAVESKRKAVESYIRTKAKQQKITDTMAMLLLDWIQTGNCFGQLVYTKESKKDPITEEIIPGYTGPKLMRISPYDIVFNIASTDFKSAPKIIRSLKSMGELLKDVNTKPELGYTKDIIKKLRENRSMVLNNHQKISNADLDKARGFVADGFGDIIQYYNSNLVEILEFYGDLYDPYEDKLYENHVITIVDRAYVIRKEPIKSWSGSPYIYHCGWRKRPDNLLGMSPLENLVGMQYKINKLENLRADVFDQIAFPQKVIKGNVTREGDLGAPGTVYIIDDGDGDVRDLAPNPTALNADTQIRETLALMEELAGAPREAMGIRSPGEKTAFEVQSLDNAASRIFQNKIRWFESQFIEPILNDMLEMGRRNLDGADLVRMQDATFGLEVFLEVTKEDLTAAGKLYPKGSQHFAQKAQLLQVLTGLLNSPALQMLAPHMSRLGLGETLERLAGIDKFALIKQNVGVMEDAETQRVMATIQDQIQAEGMTSVDEMQGPTPGETPRPPTG